MSKKCDLLATKAMTGNKVSHSNRKTKRKFNPNLNILSFASDALGTKVNLRVSSATLRTVNKYGSLDSFLVNYRFSKLTDLAKKLRRKIQNKLIKLGKLEEVKVVAEKKAAKPKKATVAKKAVAKKE